MIILQREAEKISEENNVEAAQLRQQWLSLERQVNFAFKDLEKLWIQQKTRLVEKHVEEQTNEIEKRFETKTAMTRFHQRSSLTDCRHPQRQRPQLESYRCWISLQ